MDACQESVQGTLFMLMCCQHPLDFLSLQLSSLRICRALSAPRAAWRMPSKGRKHGQQNVSHEGGEDSCDDGGLGYFCKLAVSEMWVKTG